jgi:hypothetical protein
MSYQVASLIEYIHKAQGSTQQFDIISISYSVFIENCLFLGFLLHWFLSER